MDERYNKQETCKRGAPCNSNWNHTDEESILLRAMTQYQERWHRQFPTWSEVLAIFRSLGYRKVEEPTALPTYPLRQPK